MTKDTDQMEEPSRRVSAPYNLSRGGSAPENDVSNELSTDKLRIDNSGQNNQPMWAMKQEDSEHPAEMAWRGIALCREDDWQEGLYWLSTATESGARTAELPGLMFSYLGYGLARYQNQPEEGLKLCKLGVEVEVHQAESYYLLARSHLFLGDRRSAVPVIEQGLQVDAVHEGLNQLKLFLGQRRRPVFPSLSRRHVLNRWLGKIRHWILEWWGRSGGQSR